MVIGIDAIHKHLCYFWNWICAIPKFHIIVKIIDLIIAISCKMNLLVQKDIKCVRNEEPQTWFQLKKQIDKHKQVISKYWMFVVELK
jgi:hypothetical protein